MDIIQRQRRHKRVRKHISGAAQRPRVSIYRSLNHIYAQLIDDIKGHTLISAGSLDKEFNEYKGHKGNVKMAGMVGELLAKRALSHGIKKVVFDKGGYLYHGSVKALAEACRKAGLEF